MFGLVTRPSDFPRPRDVADTRTDVERRIFFKQLAVMLRKTVEPNPCYAVCKVQKKKKEIRNIALWSHRTVIFDFWKIKSRFSLRFLSAWRTTSGFYYPPRIFATIPLVPIPYYFPPISLFSDFQIFFHIINPPLPGVTPWPFSFPLLI